ncbi:MAG: hypothetical protein JST82_05450 [Bacteroidetes bacterium]|nr:hypothetical protein [Bacteroidota bacterium]
MKKIILSIGFLLLSISLFAKAPVITYVKMDRTACFGHCPTYTVEVYSNGLVRYTGVQFTDVSGTYEKNIGAAKAKQLLAQFSKYRVDTCKNLYESNIADLPGMHFEFKIDGKDKTISNANFGPKFLRELGMKVDAETNPLNGWKKQLRK